MGTYLRELAYAARGAGKKPVFTLAATLTLALGIGANTVVFSWIRGVLLVPLVGVTDHTRVVEVLPAGKASDFSEASYPDYVDFRDGTKTFSSLACHALYVAALTDEGKSERVWLELVSANYFSTLGVKPEAGRLFLANEDQTPLGNPTVVMSYATWQRRFGGDPRVIGKNILVNGHSFSVIGVAAQNFRSGYSGLTMDLWVTVNMQKWFLPSDRLTNREIRWLSVLGRLAEGVTMEQARGELAVLAAGIDKLHPAVETHAVTVQSLAKSPNGPQRVMGPVLPILLAVVCVVLLVACANVANLLLVRAAGRQREIAVRLSLGASRGRIARLVLAEAAVLAVLGGLLAFPLAWLAANGLSAMTPPMNLPIAMDVRPSAVFLALNLLLALLAAVIIALAPVRISLRTNVVAGLKADTRAGIQGAAHSRMRNALVVSQVAMTAMLLVMCALFMRSFYALQEIHPGFETKNVLLASLDLFPKGFSPEQNALFMERAHKSLGEIPGVESVSVTRVVPLGFGGYYVQAGYPEGHVPQPGEVTWIYLNRVGPDYFSTLRQPILRGREFTFDDRPGQQRVAIISQAMADRWWPGQDPIGRNLKITGATVTVIGVTANSAQRFFGEEPARSVYVPISQDPATQATLVIRSAQDPANLTESVRRVMERVDPTLALYNICTFAQHAQAATFPQKIAGQLVGMMGLFTLIMAVIGLYGVIAYTVAQRTHEIGVRMALGASLRDVLHLVLRQGLILIGIGLAIGITGALASAHFAGALITVIGTFDVVSYLLAVVVLGGAAVAACLVPAWRAVKIEPSIALRCE